MKHLLYFTLVLGVIAGCSSGPEDSGLYTIEQFYENENVLGGTFAHNESSLLITSNKSGIYNVFALPMDGTTPSQLTRSELESCYGISYFPNDHRMLFSSDKGGNEESHIFIRMLNGREKDLTPEPNSKNIFFSWSQDGNSFFYLSNKRDPSTFDLYEMPVDEVEKYKPSSEVIYENNARLNVKCISHDKKFLALVKTISNNNSDMFLYDIENKRMTIMSKHIGDANFDPQYFSTNNHDLFYLTNENNEYTYLAKFNVLTNERNIVYQPRWDIESASMSFNGKYRIVTVNEDARNVVHVFDTDENAELQLPNVDGGSITSAYISKSEKLMSMTIERSTSPKNIYLYNFADKKLTKLTNTLNPAIHETSLVAGKTVRYRSFDGTDIPAIYYQPKIATAKSQVPAIVFVHGGPGGQTMLRYSALFQYLVNQGYAILAVNNRGSSGYGKTFYRLDDKKHGEDDLKDCIEGKKFLASTGVIDMNRVAIMGGSYGGYLTMAALTYAPNEFNAGVNIFGVTNWMRTLKSIPVYWESQRNALYDELGDPYSDDSVRLIAISPLFHADKITKPLMVLQGANDVRVLQAESDEIVAAVKANGVPVEYILFSDEGHGFRKKQNEIKAYGQVKIFLDTYLSTNKNQAQN